MAESGHCRRMMWEETFAGHLAELAPRDSPLRPEAVRMSSSNIYYATIICYEYANRPRHCAECEMKCAATCPNVSGTVTDGSSASAARQRAAPRRAISPRFYCSRRRERLEIVGNGR